MSINGRRTLRSVIFVAVFLTSAVLATGLAGQLLGGHDSFLPSIPRVNAQPLPILGIDCGLGSTAGVATPSGTTTFTSNATGTPVTTSFGPSSVPVSGDGALDTGCSWAGDATATYNSGIADTTPEPLVADVVDSTLIPNPFSCTQVASGCVSSNYGGGFNAEVRVTGLEPACNIQVTSVNCPNGFDITVSYDPKILNAVSFDQYGLEFCPSTNPPCGEPLGASGVTTVAATIDNTVGQARLAQALLGAPSFPDTAGNAGVTLFRVRFDVVGVGTSNILASGTVTNPGAITHTEQPATFEDTTVLDPTALGWSASFAFTPNPPAPGSSMKFTATAACLGCTAPLSFAWDFSSHGGPADSTANPATITPPPPTVNRVTLTISDAALHSVTLVQLVPFAVALIGPPTVAVGSAASYNGLWLGGTPTYQGTMRLCPGQTTPPQLLVCTNPSPPVVATSGQTAPASNTYHFAGVFTNKLTMSTTASGGVAAQTLSATQLTNVTGSPAAFSISANPSPTSITAGQSVSFTSTAAYEATYPAYAASADTLINGTAPALATTLFQDNTHIRFTEQVGCVGCQINGLWDPSEWIFYCPAGCATLPANFVGAFVLYHGTVTKPLAGAATKADGRIKFTGAATFAQGDPVIYDWDSATAGGLYDASLTFTFKFGDGTQTSVSSGLASTASGGFTAAINHVYTLAGTFQPVVIVQETGTPAGTLGPVSAIQESGFTSPVSVFDFTLSTPSPNALTVAQGATSSTSSITATLAGGTAQPVTFSATGLPAGVTPNFTNNGCSPTCTITVSFSATATATIGPATVTINALSGTAGHSVTISLTVTQGVAQVTVTVNCGAATVGKPVQCSATASGGTGTGFTFSWSAPGGSPATGTSASFTTTYPTKGSKTITTTATDSGGATGSKDTIVPVAGQPIVVTATCPTSGVTAGKPFNCTVSAIGGTAPYSGTGTISRTESVKGTKTESFTVTDANSASASGSASVTVAAQPLVVTVTCPTSGVTAGKPFDCTVSATGGTAPYTGTGTISGTESTKGTKTESFTVTDTNAVSASGSASVTVAAQPLVVTVTCPTSGVTAGKPFNCTVSAAGGTTPYTGTGTVSRTEPVKGTKTESFTVTDANAASASGSASVTINAQPLVPDFTDTVTGTSVSFTATATGGTGPYSFTWDFGDSSPTGTGSSISHTYTVTTTTTFHVKLTATDGNTATASVTKAVTVSPVIITVTVNCPTTGQTAGKPVNCTASASGGTGTITLAWSAPGGNPATGPGASFTTTYAAKGSDTITVTGTDANGAQGTGTATVTVAAQPLTVTATCPSSGLTAGKPFNCTVAAVGGTTPYTGTGTISKTETVKGTFTESFTVTDANGASASGSASVTISAQPLVVTATCPSTGITAGKPFTCTVSATGGTAPYTGTGSISKTEPVKGTFIETFSVTDNNAATISGTTSVTVAAQPIAPDFTSIVTGQTVQFTASATGGTSPYTFTWDFGDSNTGTGSPVSHTYASPGTFTVVVTAKDNNGVTATATHTVSVATVTFTVTVTCPTSGQTAGKPVNCTASAQAGSGQVTFSWSAPGGSPATGTGSSFTTVYATKGSDIITVTGTNSSNAQGTGTATVTVAAQPLAVSVTCGGPGPQPCQLTAGKPVSFTVSITGGTAPYTVSWSAPGGTPSSGSGNSFTTTFAAKGTFTISASATDQNGASQSGSVIEVIAAQPFTADFTFTPPSPSSGQVVTFTATPTGGSTPYAFHWNFTAGFGAPTATGNPVQHIYNVTSTTTFTVFLVVVDANGVTATAAHDVTVTPTTVTITVTVSCGSATVGKPVACNASASGGTGTLTISWSAPSGSPATGTGTSFTTTYSAKGSDTVTATATDTTGATGQGTASVTVTGQPIVVTVTCGTASAGKPVTCNASATGGTGPYTFTWSSNGNPATGTGSSYTTTFGVKGSHTVTATATDGNSVTASGTAIVTVLPQPLTVSVAVSPQSPCLGTFATFSASVSGGTSPYGFNWNFGDGTTGTGNPVQHTYTVAGLFTVKLNVTDANNISTTASTTVATVASCFLTVDFAPKLTIVGSTTFVPLITGGTPAFSCTWNFGDGSALATTCLATHLYTNPGKFNVTLTVMDSTGASASTLSPVRVQLAPRISGQAVQNHILPGQTENITITVRNTSSLSVDIVLSVQIFNITGHSNTLVTTLTRSFTLGPSSSMTVTLQFKPAAVVADYRDVAMISYSHSFGDLNGDGTPETVTGTSPFQSRRGFSVVLPSIVGQTVQAQILPGQTEQFIILVRNPTHFTASVVLTVQIFDITGHTNTPVTTLTQSITIGPMSTMPVSFSWTPPSVVADYRDVAQIVGTSFQSRRGFSVV